MPVTTDRAAATLVARGGLTAAGAVLVIAVLGVVGGAYDLLTGTGLRTVFGLFFVAGCGLAALLVRQRDLRAAVVMPPLVYVALALLAGAVEDVPGAGSLLSRQALGLVNAVVLGAPVVLGGTALAVAVALYRGVARPARP